MKQLLLAGVIAGTWSASALAADLGPYRPPPYEPTYDSARDVQLDWHGIYVGANAGYAWGDGNGATFSGPGVGGAFGSLEPEGWLGGGQIGFNLQFNRLVLGAEADIQAADISDFTTGFAPGIGAASASTDVNWFSTVRARAGIATGPTLLYVTGGLAFADVDYSATAGGLTLSESDIKTGWTVGGGLEWAFGPQWSLKTEYLYVDLGDETLSGGGFTSHNETDFHTVRAGLNYRF